MVEESENTAVAEKTKKHQLFGSPRTSALFLRFLSSLRFSNIRRRSWRTKASLFLVVAAIASGFATYAALTDTPPFGNDPQTVVWLLNIDLILLTLLVALIAKRLVAIWSGRKRGIAGSHLHVRLVYIFSFLAAAPTIIMTVFSAFFFHFGVQTWFSERVHTAINESLAVAESYLEEHKQVLRADAMAMSADLERQADIFRTRPKALETIVETQSMLRNLPEAIIFTKEGKILARSELTISLALEKVPNEVLREADLGDVVLMTGANRDRVRALIKLDNFDDSYLFVGRLVDQQVLEHLSTTAAAVEDYAQLQTSFAGMQITVTLLFVVVGLLMLLAAIWFSLILARELVTPISELIKTSDSVRSGDLTARVPEEKSLEEFEYLAKSFNRMTSQIQQQQEELIRANLQIDIRRRLTESVLKGVSSGVIGADDRGVINLVNASALSLLKMKQEDLIAKPVLEVIPEISDLFQTALKSPGRTAQREIILELGAPLQKNKRTYLFRMGVEQGSEGTRIVILTFDDITEFQAAQRKAAWSDVARRIAHEIKNPLTPIQLSAERLKKKYLSQITEDPETFSNCTQTIIRHVGDIGRMVDEFSSFARMPEPVMKTTSLAKEVQESLILPQQAHAHIKIETCIPFDEIKQAMVELDPVQLRQVINNLVQNAVDSINARRQDQPDASAAIQLLISMRADGWVFVSLSDSGQGLPLGESPSNLAEPYITHKPKGTGLGLAIVKKIMEDHRGELVIGLPDWVQSDPAWKDLGGATVAIAFPQASKNKSYNDEEKTQKKEVA